jgi:rare lipoprotein A
MNFKIWSGLASASVLMATILGTAPSTGANTVTGSVTRAAAEETKIGQVASTSSDASTTIEVPVASGLSQIVGISASAARESAANQPVTTVAEAVKVGEYQADERAEEAVAVMQSYESDGRQVATLYVRNLPVLSFLGAEGSANQASNPSVNPGLKVGSSAGSAPREISVSQPHENPNDPAARATAIAAQINQLNRNHVDARTIRAVWDEPKQRYLIKVGEDTLTAIGPGTILADTTNNAEQDALQATNRLRRLLGNVEPLTEVEGAPRASTLVSVGPVQLTVSGYASWYGPGFNGNLSASGEVFNENALTAAHRSLPFGTQVRVTNMDNGRSVVVRINDRGPYSGDRLIDLSAGAAEVIGLTASGVAPVKLDVLGAASK